MEKFLEKFSLYEFFAYFIPGSIFLALLWILCNFFGVNLKSFFVYKNSLIESILIIFGGYFAGIIIHEIGEIIQKPLKFIWGGFPSERFMNSDSDILINSIEIEQYKNFAENKFSIDVKTNKDADLFFHRVRDFLKDDAAYNDAELINNNYGMYRSFLALSVIFLIGFIVNSFYHLNKGNLCIVLFLVVIVCILARRLKRFGETYVKKILRAGYAKFKKEG